MLTVESSLLSTLVSLSAAFLALSIVVQICQEIWKYLTNSKSRAYRQALEDFLGPWANDVMRQHGQLALRGPFELFRLKPGRTFLPISKDALGTALERTASPWVHRTLQAIELECRLQGNSSLPPSKFWQEFLSDLSAAGSGANDVREFLAEWGGTKKGTRLPDRLDARQLLVAFRHRFYRDADAALESFPEFEKNFEFTYKRRNLRQTFTIALLIAFFTNLPFEVLYQKASALSPDEATAVAEKTITLYDRSLKDSLGRADMNSIALVTDATRLMTQSFQPAGVDYLVDLGTLRTIWKSGGIFRHILGLLITALLTSFGAPVWNDLRSLLLRTVKETRRKAEDTA